MALLTALGMMQSLPVLVRGAEVHLRKHLRKHKKIHSFLNYNKVKSQPVLSVFKIYLTEKYEEQEPLMKRAFTYKVDTGC